MIDTTLITVILRKLIRFDSLVIRRCLEIAMVLGLIWIAAVAKQKGPKELEFVTTIFLIFGPFIVVLQFIFLLMAVIQKSATDLARGIDPNQSNEKT